MIESTRCIQRLPERTDIPSIIAFYTRNRSHLANAGPLKTAEFYTPQYWETQITKAHRQFQQDESLRLILFHKEEANIIGTINFTQFERGGFQNCRLGYQLNQAHEGQGLMFEALQAAIGYVFNDLNFHRIEANVMPRNTRSRQLLKRLGFQEHGIAPHYLKINGAWEDHVLTSIIRGDGVQSKK